MPFPSYLFLFAFLPAALAGCFLCGRRGSRAASLWLAAASLLFYAWADARALPLLLLLGGTTFFAGRAIAGRRTAGRPVAGPLAASLALLAVAGIACKGHPLPGDGAWRIGTAAVPWALSFFLLAQAAYLVDVARRGTAAGDALSYGLFLGFFPKVPAGPPLPYAEWAAQRARPEAHRFQPGNAAAGLDLFARGLAKKVLLADNLALLARHLFDELGRQGAPGPFFAWLGALAFAFQIYFELSGYADMARGAARMFNVDLPPLCEAPYRAASLSGFWSRWYAPLWRFGRELLALLPAKARAVAPPLACVALGLWHGATWPFLAWGAWHGLGVAAQRGWRGPRLPSWAAGGLTFLAVLAGWVVFRSWTLPEAGSILAAMAGFGPHGESPSRQVAALLTEGSETKEYALAFAALAASPFVAFRLPRERPLSLARAMATALLLLLSILAFPSAREFLYARF